MIEYRRPPSVGRAKKTTTVTVEHENLDDALREAGDFVEQLEYEGIVSVACVPTREWDDNWRAYHNGWEVVITYYPIHY